MNRREFLGGLSLATVGAALPNVAAGEETKEKLRGALLHLGMNMWGDYASPKQPRDPNLKYTYDYLRMDEGVWKDITALMQRRKYNFAVIDVGEGVIYPSQPKLAVKGSWTPEKLNAEVRRLRAMGIEAIPKLNFSAAHDGWLGPYGHVVSSPIYYRVVKGLINDICDIFENPRFVHLGMDEENAEMQAKYSVVVVRRGDLLWHDLDFMFDCVEARHARPIVFAGTLCEGSDEFYRRMRKTVVQNMGIYGSGYDLTRLTDESLPARERNPLGYKQWFNDMIVRKMRRTESLVAGGYDILSCSSNWIWNYGPDGKELPYHTGKDREQDRRSCDWLHKYLAAKVPSKQLLGEMVAPWLMMVKDYQYYWQCGINQLADAMDGLPVAES